MVDPVPADSLKAAESVLSGGGEMGELMRSLDWSKTPLGPVAQWPQSLKTSVSTCLNSRFAILVWWGKDLVKLYNDAYIAILGNKHPRALGSPGRQVWPEIWHIIGPMLEGVLERGEATWSDNLLLELERNGYPEECYFTFSYSPIRDESGGVGGVFTPVQETTAQVIGERRLRTLRALAEAWRAANAQNTEHVCRVASESLRTNPHDIPFAAFYLLSENGSLATRCSTAGISHPSHLLPDEIELEASDWVFAGAAQQNEIAVVELSSESNSDLPCGVWPIPPQQAAVLPLVPGGHRTGFLIAGLNPRKRYDDDYGTFLSIVARHITTAIADAQALEQERKRAAALAELDRAKTQFFSNVSHEFRTPLTLLLGPLEELLGRKGTLPSEIHTVMEVAHRNALRLLRLVNSLLDFSRVEAGRTRARYEPTNLCSLTADLASSFQSAMERAGLKFQIDCRQLPSPVYVDRDMWEKIVLNLLSNAFKFTLNGTVSVRLRSRDTKLELQVQDTGIGIPERELPSLFERFHRVEGAQGRTHEGSGIGLALVRELVNIHGGSIQVSSTEGKGTTFTVSLPFGKDHLPQEHVVSGAEQSGTPVRAEAYVEEALRWLPESSAHSTVAPVSSETGAKPKVLVADDNSDMRDYIHRLLADRYEIRTASNGSEALRMIAVDKPDLVLSDVMMPGLDGFELLQAIRADPSIRTTPIILLSARAGEEARNEGMEAGADDYLTKPFSARELIARVAAHLRLAQARKRAEEQTSQLLTIENRKWRDLFSQIPAAIALLRGPDHRYLWCNSEYVHLVNRSSPVDLLGKCLREALPEVATDYYDIFDDVYRTGQPHFEREAYVRLGTPEPHGVYVNFVCLPTYDFKGVIDGLFVHATDVTDFVIARKRVEDSEQQFRTLAESMPNLAWMADETGQIFWYNQRWYDYTGTSLEEVEGWQWTSVHDPNILPQVVENYRHSIATGEPFEMIFPLRSAAGEYRQFLTRAQPLKDISGRVFRWFGTNTDITEQRKTEQELRRINRELEEFAYVASHDLREPLRMVNIYTQLMLKKLGPQPEKINEYATLVRQGVARMEGLIDDLLIFSRTVQSDQLPASNADLSRSLSEAMTVLKSMIEESHAVIEVPTLPVVRGDETQFTHVFQNLLSNALKYKRADVAPCIKISTHREGDCWQIGISDNGIGFEQQYAQRIFGLFKRLHKDEYPGTGLGLAICQRIVERYGGQIWAESRLGEGSTFYFSLPAAEEQ